MDTYHARNPAKGASTHTAMGLEWAVLEYGQNRSWHVRSKPLVVRQINSTQWRAVLLNTGGYFPRGTGPAEPLYGGPFDSFETAATWVVALWRLYGGKV